MIGIPGSQFAYADDLEWRIGCDEPEGGGIPWWWLLLLMMKIDEGVLAY